MDYYTNTLIERIKLINHTYNKSDKYLDYFQNEQDYYNKIHNKLDDLLKVSYWLAKFLTGTPPRANHSKDLDGDDELVYDYDQPQQNSNQANLKFNDGDFTIANMDLPAEVESEFDFYFHIFHAYLAYIKPAYYFIHEHELVPKGTTENLKEKTTRILVNLVQLLILVRSSEAVTSNDIKNIALSLLYKYEELFVIHEQDVEKGDSNHDDSHDDLNSTEASHSFHEEFPNDAAIFTLFILARDDVHEDSYEDFKNLVQVVFESFSGLSKYDDYQNVLNSNRPLVNDALVSSSSISEFQSKLQAIYKFDDLKDTLSKFSKILANKVLKIINSNDDWDLKTEFLSQDYPKIILETKSAYELQLTELRQVIEEEFEEKNARLLKELENNWHSAEDRAKLLNEELNISKFENERLKADIHNAFNNKNQDSKVVDLQSFQKNNKKIYDQVRNQTFRIAYGKLYNQISLQSQEIDKLKKELSEANSTNVISENDENNNNNGHQTEKEINYDDDLPDNDINRNGNGKSLNDDIEEISTPGFYQEGFNGQMYGDSDRNQRLYTENNGVVPFTDGYNDHSNDLNPVENGHLSAQHIPISTSTALTTANQHPISRVSPTPMNQHPAHRVHPHARPLHYQPQPPIRQPPQPVAPPTSQQNPYNVYDQRGYNPNIQRNSTPVGGANRNDYGRYIPPNSYNRGGDPYY